MGIFTYFKNRRIKNAIKKWAPKQTEAQLVNLIANELVECLEKSGLTPDQIQKAVSDNNKFIVEAVSQGDRLMSLCESIKDSVLAKNASIDAIKDIVLKTSNSDKK